MSEAQQPPFPPLGAIVSFQASPDSMALLVPAQEPGKPLRAFCGEVVTVKPMQHYQPGNIPTAAVVCRGRTGRQVTIDGVACDLRVHESWAEALAACEAFNRSTAAALPVAAKAKG